MSFWPQILWKWIDWVTCECISYNFIPILQKHWWCFLHGMRMCMWFECNHYIILLLFCNLIISNSTEFHLRLYGVKQIDKTSQPFTDKAVTLGDVSMYVQQVMKCRQCQNFVKNPKSNFWDLQLHYREGFFFQLKYSGKQVWDIGSNQ